MEFRGRSRTVQEMRIVNIKEVAPGRQNQIEEVEQGIKWKLTDNAMSSSLNMHQLHMRVSAVGWSNDNDH